MSEGWRESDPDTTESSGEPVTRGGDGEASGTGQRGDSRALSPVVGVVVLIAIVIVLASVTSGFFIDLTEQLGEEEDADPPTPTPTASPTPTPTTTATCTPTPTATPTPTPTATPTSGVSTPSPTPTPTPEPC